MKSPIDDSVTTTFRIRTFLHFFHCKRSCDNVKEYCKVCSHVRYRNFQKLCFYDDVILEQRDHYLELGLKIDQLILMCFCQILIDIV